MIRCENLVKIYKTRDLEVLALQGMDINIAPGELMAIVGNSGSGKSTFLNMLGGLDRPTAGKLYVDGKNLFKMTEKELVEYKRKTVGFVWQNNARNLLPYLSASHNVQMPMVFDDNTEKEKRALDLLDLVGMVHKKDSKLSQLSGGEQQRIALAIALANHPKILLADEPTGSVDTRTGNYILDVFRKVNREMGITVVIVTHDMKLTSKVNRVVSIRDGKTSSEKIMRQSYARELENIQMFSEQDEAVKHYEEAADVHEEYAVLDRAGRVQIPRELLDKMGIKDNRIKMEYKDGKIILSSEDE
ncbi:MAG: ATP-binding cassette domain-containing protein [Lachnospiraceae bacterium]|nr:ATP-binding cassette domain-containing protein [Lachnospiraceae bacterium]